MIENILSVNSADTVGKIASVKPAERSSDINAKEPEKVSENRDEYVLSEEKEPIGLYDVAPDENGEPRISFDKSADESTAAELRRKLEQVTAELAQKDNDEYRRQNAVFT